MAEVKKIATRDSYGNTLKELAAEGHDDLVVLDADLAAATKTGMFRKAYPDRHFDCGIAEGNMMGVAAGLATMGYVPFVSSFAMFAAGRAFEQIRNSIAYPRLNVKIGATHGGISVGEDGASHQCCEDFALMRSLPGMTVICPADDVEARAAVRAAYAMQGPVYLRFGRLAVPVFHDEATYHFELGKGEQITEGSDIAIIATGLMVNEAYYFNGHWETFGGLNWQATKRLALGCTVVNFLNQTGAKGSIAGAELITKDEAKGIKNQIMTGSYLRPFTVEFTASLKF